MNQQLKQPSITPEIIKNSAEVKCDCGGKIFMEKLYLKKLSAILSPSGNEELIPIPILVCDKCGKVPSFMDPQNVLPKDIKSSSITI